MSVTGREVDVVIAATPDRLSRNGSHLLVLYEEWQRTGIQVHFCLLERGVSYKRLHISDQGGQQ